MYKDERPTRFLENEVFDQWLIAKDTLVDGMRLFIVNILEEAVLHEQTLLYVVLTASVKVVVAY